MTLKHFNIKTLITIILMTTVACNTSTSTKGKWSKEDKEKVKSEIAEELKEDDDYKEIKNNKDSKKLFDEIINCAVEKMESKYNNYDEAAKDEAGLDKIGEKCGEEVVERYLKSAFENLGDEINSEIDTSAVETPVNEDLE